MITESWFSLEFVKTLIWIKKHGLPGRSKFCMLWHRQSGKSQLKSGHEVCSSSIWCKTSLEAKSGWAIYEGCQQEFIDWLSCGFRAFWFSISSGNLIGYEKKKLTGIFIFFLMRKSEFWVRAILGHWLLWDSGGGTERSYFTSLHSPSIATYCFFTQYHL